MREKGRRREIGRKLPCNSRHKVREKSGQPTINVCDGPYVAIFVGHKLVQTFNSTTEDPPTHICYKNQILRNPTCHCEADQDKIGINIL
jgi:hypothetical protein